MSHPETLLAYLETQPFLGRASLSRTEVIAGEWLELVATYEVGAAGLADGAWLKLVFRFYSDWGLFQTTDPKAANYVSVAYEPRPELPGESPATVRALKVRFDQKGHERPFQKAVVVDVVDGYLKPGDRVVLRLGDQRYGGPGTRAQTFAEDAFCFRVFVDPVGASRFAAVPGELQLRIVAGPAERPVLITPRLSRPGCDVPVTFRYEDRWGNLAKSGSEPSLELWPEGSEQPILRQGLELSPDGAWARVFVQPPKPGHYRLTAAGAEALLTVDELAPEPRMLFADLHIHSQDTVGVNSTASVLAYARDPAGLDVAGYTANDFNVRADRWQAAVEVCRGLQQPGRFLCFPGTEWCGASAVGGDRNVIFLGEEVRFPLDDQGRSLRVFDWNEDTARDRALQADVATAAGLHAAYRDLADGDRALLIPHVGGRRAIFDWHDAALERLVEVASSWGHFDWFYREALARGLRVGASAAGDEHRGRPGGGAPGVGSFGVAGGLTGVLAAELTPRAVARALRARRTWATTGQRAVALLSTGAHRQGDEFAYPGDLEVEYAFYAAQQWERIELRDDQGTVLHVRDLDEEAGWSDRLVRVRWGGARIRDRYRWAEWHGVVEVVGSPVLAWRVRGLEHVEERVVETAPGIFRIRTDTYGDADQLELELADVAAARISLHFEVDAYNKTGDVLARNRDPRISEFEQIITGEELLQRPRRLWDLGGAELFVAAERLGASPLPSFVSGRVRVPAVNGPHGYRAIHAFGRERDDAKAWTSPLFIRFQT